MRATLSLALSLAIAVAAAPIPTTVSPRGSLLNLSPVLDPIVKLGGDHSCTGIGISACDPINVGGDQNNDKASAGSDDSEGTDSEADDDSDPLINIAPVISPDVSVGGDNGCLGIGISVCDPINVDGSQNNS